MWAIVVERGAKPGGSLGARNCCTIAAPLTIVLVILSNFFQVKSGCSLFDRFTPTT
jgi:hypothetical protein